MRVWAIFILWALASCSGRIIAERPDFIVAAAGSGDTARSLAQLYYNDPDQAWRIEELNGGAAVQRGAILLIPKLDWRPSGVTPDGVQTVPILTYHAFKSAAPCK